MIDQLAINDLKCIEKEMTIENLLQADEVFLTNSIYNIRWVKSIADKNFSHSVIQRIYASLTPTIL